MLSGLGMREGSKVRLAPVCSHRDLWPHAQHLAMRRVRSLVNGTQSVQCADPSTGGRREESKKKSFVVTLDRGERGWSGTHMAGSFSGSGLVRGVEESDILPPFRREGSSQLAS